MGSSRPVLIGRGLDHKHPPTKRGKARIHCATLNTHPTPKRGHGLTRSQRYGGHSEGETPGHIPNPEAKPSSADGTAPARVWESRTPPNTPHRGPPPPGRPSIILIKLSLGCSREF